MLADGETIEITKHGRVVGRLVPVPCEAQPMTDFAGIEIVRLTGSTRMPTAIVANGACL